MFVCGGAFVGLEKLIEQRLGKKSLGFIQSPDNNKTSVPSIQSDEILKYVQPEDLVKFGLIPEFIGRLPVLTRVTPLDETALVSILTEPSNALVKQYKKLLRMDNVRLEFEPDALKAIAKEAFRRKTGARALRGILEELMLEVMYEIPSRKDVVRCVITQEMVEKRSTAEVLWHPAWHRQHESA